MKEGKQVVRVRAIYGSMSGAERSDPGILSASRRRRIARGAGVGVNEVAQFVDQFRLTRRMAHAINHPTARPAGKLALVLGLVTHSRVRRDPSQVYPWLPEPAWERMLWVALGVLAAALLAYAVTAR